MTSPYLEFLQRILKQIDILRHSEGKAILKPALWRNWKDEQIINIVL